MPFASYFVQFRFADGQFLLCYNSYYTIVDLLIPITVNVFPV